MTTHELKCWIGPFEAIVKGEKTFEYRKSDRDFKVGDVLHLREFQPNIRPIEKWGYTGREHYVRVTYIMEEGFGLPLEYCIMSIVGEKQTIKKDQNKDMVT